MAETHVISALTSKRSELSGLLEHYQREQDRVSAEIRTLDAAIKLFDPDYKISGIKTKAYRRRGFFKPGESTRLVLDALRNAGGLADSNTVTLSVMEVKGIEEAHKESVQKALHASLKRLEKRGVIEQAEKDPDSRALKWRLKP